MNCRSRKCKIGSLWGFSTFFIVVGITILAAWEPIYDFIINSELPLSESSISFGLWKETPIPMFIDFYLYNWTNAQEVLNNDFETKPNFEKCGPYVFKTTDRKVDMVWHDNGTVTYRQIKTWFFDEEKTNGSLDDEITNVNIIATTIGYVMRNRGTILKTLVNGLLHGTNESVITTKKARELLFEGYDDVLLDLAKQTNISSIVGIDIPFDKFAWFYERNESKTYDGIFNMFTGKNDRNKLGFLNLWNYQPYTNFYDGYCAYVNGSPGELWPTPKNFERVPIFAPDICSSMWLDYEKNSTVRGIEGRRYSSTNFSLDNGAIYPETACFNVGDPLPTGSRNVSQCKFGAPAVVTFPNFYLADKSMYENITGLNPTKSEHEFYMVLEPTTGIPLDVRAQLQINILIEPIEGMSFFSKVKKTFVPVLWFQQTATLNDKYASLLKTLLAIPSASVYVGIACLGIGFVIFFITLYLTYKTEKKDDKKALIVPVEST